MVTSICLCTHNRADSVKQVLKSILQQCTPPYEIVIVDDCSTEFSIFSLIGQELGAIAQVTSPLGHGKLGLKAELTIAKGENTYKVPLIVYRNEKNLRHAASQNLSMDLAHGDVLIHLEDDVVMPYHGWNQTFAKVLQDHPEVGQVLPVGSGRGEWIERPGYHEFAWGLGGVWAITKQVYMAVGGWDTSLVHQLEPDYNLRVRMAGWRVAGCLDIPQMHHLGEGFEQETFGRQLSTTIGVYNMLRKWNARFFGFWDYRSVWSMSWDDFPPNVAFRRMTAAALGMKLNENPEPFQFKGHWGKYELVRSIRPPGREREAELINKMQSGFHFKDEHELFVQVLNLAKRMDVKEWQGFDMTTAAGVKAYLKDKALDYAWVAEPMQANLSKPSIHDPNP